jgi:hypothetical protein
MNDEMSFQGGSQGDISEGFGTMQPQSSISKAKCGFSPWTAIFPGLSQNLVFSFAWIKNKKQEVALLHCSTVRNGYQAQAAGHSERTIWLFRDVEEYV